MVTVRVVSRPAAGREDETHRVCHLVHDLSSASRRFAYLAQWLACHACRFRARDRDVTGFMRHCGAPSHGLGGAERHRTVQPRDARAVTQDFGKSMWVFSAPTRVSGNGLPKLPEAVRPSGTRLVRAWRAAPPTPRATARIQQVGATDLCRSRHVGASILRARHRRALVHQRRADLHHRLGLVHRRLAPLLSP
jgi:hypothetical protein